MPGGVMERRRFEKEGAWFPHLPRATLHIPGWSLPNIASNLPAIARAVLGRYGVALVLAGLVLLLRRVLPFPEGTGIYQLPIAAVVLSAWYGGRGPGLFASVVCATGTLYWFVPPRNSFEISPDHALAFWIFIALCLLLSEFSSGRRRTQNALRASEERFRALVQFSFDVYWESDARHRFSRQELSEQPTDAPSLAVTIGKTPWEIPYVAPDEETWRKHRATLDAHLPFRDFEVARPTAGGGTRYVSISGMPVFNAIGRFVGYRGVGRDITQRKLVEAELRARQEMLELAQTAARAVAFDWYIGSRKDRNWSPELEAMYDLEPGTFDGSYESWRQLIHPDDRPAVELAIERAGASGAIAVEYRVIYKNGTVHWLRAKGRMFFDDRGRPERMVGFMSDVTDRRQAEEELRASEERFRTFVDRASDAFFLLDERVRVVDVNRQACDSLGWRRDELIGMHPRMFDAGLDETSIGRLTQRIGAGEIITFETRHRRKDSTMFPVEVRTGTFEQGGKRYHLALARDISERMLADEELRATEARFRTLVEAAADGFMLHAEDATVIDVNRQACENLGYSRQELIGMKPADFDADLDAQALQRVSNRIGPGDIVTIETHHRRKDGTVFPVELRLRQVLQGGRRLTISFARDITERKRVEEERERRRQLEAELARVSRLTTLGELTASIAHEVSQPLGGMVASAGACVRWLAAQPPAIREAQAALNNIVADGKRAREVIARIRALTKRQAPRKERLDLNYKIAEVVALTEHELRRHDIVLHQDLASMLPRVSGDRVQLQQVLLNLIMNAIEAMSAVHDRSRELTIVSRQDGSDAVLVKVSDSGIGLDRQQTEQVFEAFYTTKADGIGIGLSISRSIIEAHGGRLWASSNTPHGAIFCFSLPVAEEEAS
jgi:PAS domain S-box-containing protein